MRKLFLVTICMAIFLSSCISDESRTLKICEEFLKYWARADNAAMLGLSKGEQIEKEIKMFSIRKLMPDIEVHRHSVEIMDKTFSQNGSELKLKVLHEFSFDPAGVDSPFGTKKAVFNHSFSLKKTSGGWKVTSFIPYIQEIGDK